jgi:hypothetical protein
LRTLNIEILKILVVSLILKSLFVLGFQGTYPNSHRTKNILSETVAVVRRRKHLMRIRNLLGHLMTSRRLGYLPRASHAKDSDELRPLLKEWKTPTERYFTIN